MLFKYENYWQLFENLSLLLELRLRVVEQINFRNGLYYWEEEQRLKSLDNR